MPHRAPKPILLLLAGALIFITLLTSRAAEQTRDSLVYAYSAKTGSEVLHPHHLLYTPAIRLFYQALGTVCASCDAVFAAQLHNILWSTAGVLALFLLVRSLLGPAAGLAAAFLLLFARGFWELSSQTTMYAPATAILAVTSAVLVVHPGARKPFPGVFLLGALFAAAVLYHQSNLLFALPLGVYLITAYGKRGGLTWMGVLGFAGGITLSAYLRAYLSTQSAVSPAGFIRFCLAYTTEICFGGECKASPDNWGSLANLSASGAQQMLDSLLWNVVVWPGRAGPAVLILFGTALLALGFWHLVRIFRRAEFSHLRAFALAWAGIYTAFYTWWLPSYSHPFVLALIPGLLLVLLFLRDIAGGRPGAGLPGRVRPQALASLIACSILFLGLRNFQSRIFPLHRSHGDSFQEAGALDALAPQECVFLTSYRTTNHLRYYFDRPRAVQLRNPLSFFYLDTPLPQTYTLAGEECVFVLTTYLLPGYNDNEESGDLQSGYQLPVRWLAFLAWLLDFQYDEQDRLTTIRDFTVIPMEDGDPYLRLLPTTRDVHGLEDLFRQLDAALSIHSNPFQTWLTTAYSQGS